LRLLSALIEMLFEGDIESGDQESDR
jgi:hypothetical protein